MTVLDLALGIVAGILLIVFRRQVARFFLRYRTERWRHRLRKAGKPIPEYPQQVWSGANTYIQVVSVIVGLIFIGVNLLALLRYSQSATIHIIHHSENMAASKAEQFARYAFVTQDYETAYGLLARGVRDRTTLQDFEEIIRKAHPQGFPKNVRAEYFEPMPGQQAMVIYLQGDSESESFNYRFIMEGTKETGYSISHFERSESAFRMSELAQPLSTHRRSRT